MLIGLRVVLKLFAANADNGFASFIYGVAGVFVAPFVGLSGTLAAGDRCWRIPRSSRWRFDAAGKVETMVLAPGGLLVWLIVGAIAGWLAGQVMAGGGFGVIGDIVVGLIGAFIGGIVFGMLAPGLSAGLVGSILVAFVGAVILLAVVRLISPRRRSFF